MKVKSMIVGLMLSLMAASSSIAADRFSTLEGIPVEPMSHEEMEQVEGKFWIYDYYCGWIWWRPGSTFNKGVFIYSH